MLSELRQNLGPMCLVPGLLAALAVHAHSSKWSWSYFRRMSEHLRPLRCRQNASRALSLSMVAQALLFGLYFYGMKSLYYMSSIW